MKHIIITHDERMLEYCDQVYRMEDGRLKHDDSNSHETMPAPNDANL
ncbi:hypothetical protein [Bacillus sp. OK048]|nr:hypothetical protein [Bacillus sp. OK048]